MQFDINKHRDFFIAADTDSAIFSLEPLLIKEFGIDYKETKSDDEILTKMKEYLNIYSKKLNEEYLNKLAKEKFNVVDHKFNWKTENILKSAIWTGTRRYAQYIIEKEGVLVNELDMKGLELMKSNTSKMFKKFGEDFIKGILFNTPKHELDNKIIALYKSLKTMSYQELGKPTGVKKINSCIKSKPGSGEIFSKFVINTKENSKSAIIYNDLLRFYNLDKEYESILEGDKILVINLKKNPLNITTVGIPQSNIPKNITNIIEKYIDIEKIFESAILNKLKELYADLNWSFPPLNENINKFLTWDE